MLTKSILLRYKESVTSVDRTRGDKSEYATQSRRSNGSVGHQSGACRDVSMYITTIWLSYRVDICVCDGVHVRVRV